MIRRWVGFSVVFTLLLVSTSLGAESVDAAGGDSAFGRFFVAGGPLVWVVLLPLSVVTLGLITYLFMTIRRVVLMPPRLQEQLQTLIAQQQVHDAAGVLERDGSFLAGMLTTALSELRHGRATADRAVAEVAEEQATSLLRHIEWLNIIGNVAPMIGLLGTVWGMINAFDGIVQAGGQPEPAELAGGISVALVTTWWGLIVAIPALAAYGSLRNRIDALIAEAAVITERLMCRASGTDGTPNRTTNGRE